MAQIHGALQLDIVACEKHSATIYQHGQHDHFVSPINHGDSIQQFL